MQQLSGKAKVNRDHIAGERLKVKGCEAAVNHSKAVGESDKVATNHCKATLNQQPKVAINRVEDTLTSSEATINHTEGALTSGEDAINHVEDILTLNQAQPINHAEGILAIKNDATKLLPRLHRQ